MLIDKPHFGAAVNLLKLNKTYCPDSPKAMDNSWQFSTSQSIL